MVVVETQQLVSVKRLPDWDYRLIETICRHQSQPFQWGVYDCATLFADCVLAVTDWDPLEGLAWASEREAMRLLADRGCRTMAEWVARQFDEIVPADARRGDLGYPAETKRLASPAVIVGPIAVTRAPDRWVILPRTAIVRAFKVGD